ncbi:hypothetical protein QJS66_17225 [Kocuria rhizophila]|nr:hypothetical protein QJS66_17225 [Kocuria rhizophila]
MVHHRPAMLDELMATGEVVFSGAGVPGRRGRWGGVPTWPSPRNSPARCPQPDATADALGLHARTGAAHGPAGPAARTSRWQLIQPLAAAGVSVDMAQPRTALWNLLWAGPITICTPRLLAPISGGHSAHKTPKRPGAFPLRGAPGAARLRAAGRGPAGFDPAGSPTTPSRPARAWCAPPGVARSARAGGRAAPEPRNPTVRAQAQAEPPLDRYG